MPWVRVLWPHRLPRWTASSDPSTPAHPTQSQTVCITSNVAILPSRPWELNVLVCVWQGGMLHDQRNQRSMGQGFRWVQWVGAVSSSPSFPGTPYLMSISLPPMLLKWADRNLQLANWWWRKGMVSLDFLQAQRCSSSSPKSFSKDLQSIPALTEVILLETLDEYPWNTFPSLRRFQKVCGLDQLSFA